MRFSLVVFVLVLGALPVRAQVDPSPLPYTSYGLGEGGLPYSADVVGAARAGSFTPTAEPLAFHFNPALLAGVGRSQSLLATGDLSTQYGGFGDIEGTTHAGLAAGTIVRVGGRPLALGAGVSRTKLDYGSIVRTSESGPEPSSPEYVAYETDWSAAVGAGWSGPVDLDLGVGVHRRAETFDEVRRQGLTVDLGTVLSVPVLGRTARGAVSPVFDLSTGYVQRHIGIGNEVVVSGEEVADVQTLREGVLGGGARVGLDLAAGAGHVRVVELDGRVEGVATLADEALIGRMRVGNALLGNGTDGATGRRALRVTLFDALSYTRGRAEGPYVARSTWGVAADLGGMLRLFGLVSACPALAETGDRLTFRASYSVEKSNGYRFAFGGLTLGWRP